MRILIVLLLTAFLSMGSLLKADDFYVTNLNGTVGSPGTFVSIVDLTTNTVTGYVDSNGFDLTSPVDIHLNLAGTQAYVVCNTVNAVYIIDVATETVVGKVLDTLNPFDSPNIIEIAFSINTAYVSNGSGGAGGHGSVSIISLTQNTVTGAVDATLGPLNFPTAVGVSDDGTQGLIANLSGSNVSAFDTSTNAVTGYVDDTVHPFAEPVFVTWSGSSKAYVIDANNGSNEFVNVVVANAVTGTVSTTGFPSFNVPENIVEGPDGMMYIVDTGGNNVYVVDPTMDAVTRIFTGTFSGPLGIAITNDNTTAYVANIDNNTVSIVDVATGMQTGVVDATAFPFFAPYQLQTKFKAPPPPTSTLPLRPICINGKQKTDRFGSQYELYNVISWCPSPTMAVTHYNVYRNGILIESINAGQLLSFEDQNMEKGAVNVYGVTSVSPGGESPAATVSVP